jgi:hypothetical protein
VLDSWKCGEILHGVQSKQNNQTVRQAGPNPIGDMSCRKTFTQEAAYRQWCRSSRRLLPAVMSSTVEEFVRLSLLSWARGVSPYLLTIDYRVVSRALARLFLHAFTGASADKLCRIFTTAWDNFGQARDWKSISNHTSWSITVTSQSGRMLESSGQASISLHMGNTRG